MMEIQQPDDLISISLYNVFSQRKDDRKFIKYAKDWNKKIVLHIIPFYPVSVFFEGNRISFKRGEIENADMKVTIHINNMLDIAYGRVNPFYAMEEGKLEIEGLGEDSDKLTKFYNIFVVSMEQIAQEPNLNYYEIKKQGR
ncbi:MAG: hypothetical protein EAX89_07950 [Candidatus Lokiarchaeota archaeon]|nr:hypothetical protein [Candidatus Lokiarchaeota archaeon]